MSAKKKSKKKDPAAEEQDNVMHGEEEQENLSSPAEEPEEHKENEADTIQEEADPQVRLDELNNRFLRLQADFDNYRKRMVRERADSLQRANEELLEELLPVLDHYEMGLETAEKQEADQSVIDGFKLVYDQLTAAVRKFGVERLDVEGKPFDPHQHEALTHLPSEEYAEDVVVSQYRKGYTLNGRLLRAAQVVVSSGPGPKPLETEEPSGNPEEQNASTED